MKDIVRLFIKLVFTYFFFIFLKVHCDFAAGRTIVPIMQQKYGHVSFKRYFRDYVIGFGNQALGDFWLGLARIKTLTDNGNFISALKN
jgi:hypothetical protein